MRGLLFVLLLTAGCRSAPPSVPSIADSPEPAATPNERQETIRVFGYAGLPNDRLLSASQRQYLAERAAQLDALRNLAERVGEVQIRGETSVQDLAVTADHYRSFVQTYLQGARVVEVSALGLQTIQATVEIELTEDFFACLRVWQPQCAQTDSE